MSRQKRLDDKKRETLFDLLDINKNLYSAYILKEQALDIFDETNENIALKRIKRWLENIENAGIEQFQKAAAANILCLLRKILELILENSVSNDFTR